MKLNKLNKEWSYWETFSSEIIKYNYNFEVRITSGLSCVLIHLLVIWQDYIYLKWKKWNRDSMKRSEIELLATLNFFFYYVQLLCMSIYNTTTWTFSWIILSCHLTSSVLTEEFKNIKQWHPIWLFKLLLSFINANSSAWD